ncbi:MAG: acetyl-CoA carboxylase biotin carboxylase subunit [Thermoanaerobacteraceae bacterium]|nr:acetyl-CoA carboxylase biotin carboxylase subunit [Thermoanaerobacteraceae bacterium]
MKKILIANRGEIALRVIRACKELGIETVAVYSKADKNSLHVQYADEAYCIGPNESTLSYLNMQAIISTAMVSGADAIHPGYGFLSENPFFAKLCETHKIKFIGPSAKIIECMGNKAKAKELMIKNNIPVIPGSHGAVENVDKAIKIAREIGYPVIIKASAGGGGRGMRITHSDEDLKKALELAQKEAQNAFGNSEVYIEKYIEEPKHIEFQILADEHGKIIHLGERDCSIQRRHQKILEEAPSPFLEKHPELRKEIGEKAIIAAKAAGYQGAGTIEFLLDSSGNYYFIEMNTRVQVEHGITELVTGIDIIKEQIKIASNEKLLLNQEDVKISGHALECRINAEDPDNDFRPSPGRINTLILPGGPKVRIDTHIYQGFEILPYYDSLIAKLMSYGKDRNEAISVMERALDEFKIEGIKTTIPFHKKILQNAFFKKGEIYTNFIQRRME